MACNGLKKGSFRLLVHLKWSRIFFYLEKTQFLVQNNPFSRIL